MAQEASKVRDRYAPLLHGHGIDIGAGNDPIIPGCEVYDQEQGDAQTVEGLALESFDWLFSSHCLEHMRDPLAALLHWWALVKPGGLMVVLVPDEDAYEQGFWPSLFNDDHKNTFTISKDKSWSPASTSLVELVRLLPQRKVLRIETIDTTSHTMGEDDTLTGAQAQVELVVEKTMPLQHYSPYKDMPLCPKCQHHLLLLGPKGPGLDVRCSNCGATGTYVRPNTPTS